MGKSTWPLTKSITACALGTIVATGAMFGSIYLRKSFMAGAFIAPEAFITSSAAFAAGIALVVFTSLIVIGLPVQATMQKERVTGYLWHVLPAMVFGAALFAGSMTALNAFETSIEFNDIIRGTGLGFIAATVAWLIRRPDLDNGTRIIFMAQPPVNARKHHPRPAMSHRAF